MPRTTVPDIVEVVAATSDISVATAIAAGLGDQGVEAAVVGTTQPMAERVVVVISHDATGDIRWKRVVERLQADRLAPVKVGQVDQDRVPKQLQAPNWIVWSPDEPIKSRADIFTALHSDIVHYRTHRDLHIEASVWNAAGRPDHLLINSRKRARRASQHIRDTERDVLAAPSQLITDYVMASERECSRQSRRRARRWWILGAIVGVVALVATSVIVALGTAGRANNLSAMGNATPWMIESRPDRVAMLSAGVLLVDGLTDRNLARFTLARALSEQWSAGVIGTVHSSRSVAALISADERQTLTFDGEGTLTTWDNETLEVVWRRAIPGTGPTGVLDADPRRSLVAIGSGNQLHVVRLNPWQDTATSLTGIATDIAVAPSEGYVAVQTDGALLIAGLDGSTPIAAPIDGSILDLQQMDDGSVRALLRQGDQLTIVDPRTGEVISGSSILTGQPEVGPVRRA